MLFGATVAQVQQKVSNNQYHVDITVKDGTPVTPKTQLNSRSTSDKNLSELVQRFIM